MREVHSGRAPGLWDYRWIYTYWSNNWLTVVPNKNLSLNIGFDADASHTRHEPAWSPSVLENLEWPISSVKRVIQDIRADSWSSKHIHNAYWLTIIKTRIKSRLLKWIGSR